MCCSGVKFGLVFQGRTQGTGIRINRVLVRTWEATGKSTPLRNFGGEKSSEAATRSTVKKVGGLNEDGS
jgi:hypothetical protein